jgi:murein DD-endopeptidase MepM/ murein hydrolase activator NlpD
LLPADKTDVMRKSFVITAARDPNGKAFRFTIGAHALIVVALLFVGFPALFFAGTSWGASAVIADLLRQNAALQSENANYRDATGQLAAQVSSLQEAADTLRAAAQLDPQAAKAMDRLPDSITHRAMGGGSLGDVASPVASAVTAGDPAFGLLRDVLHIIEGQLDRFRPGAERRQALAAATPSIWPVTGGLSSQYGSRSDPFTGAREFHAGLDISAGSGQPVRATADGTVTNARWNGNFGNLVVLDHGFGITTRYGHLSRFAVFEGQQIRKGEVVGFVGSTGRSTSPHVHYELLLNGRPTNPLRLLAR